jgi:AraC-like DNA-binding protein
MSGGRPEEGGHTDESVWRVPAPPLRPFIARYAGYRQAGVAPGLHRGLPSPYMTVIFTLDDPVELLEHPDPRQSPGRYSTLVGGLHTVPALVTHPGRQSGVQLLLSPLGARALLGLPAGELASTDVEGSAILGPFAEQVGERLRAARDWPARFAVLDEMLTARLAGGPQSAAARGEVSGEVRHAWRRLLAAEGRCPVSRLAAETGWSERHLRGRFRDETGLTPKAAARVIRFDRTRRLLVSQAASGRPWPALADVAAERGYYDQAHLAREFRDLAGCPPSAWLAEEFRNVQARSADPVPAL